MYTACSPEIIRLFWTAAVNIQDYNTALINKFVISN